MGSDWSNKRLDEVTTLIVDCPHSTPKWTHSGVVVLRSQNIRNGRLDLSSTSYTDEAGYQARIKRAPPTAGDLVITREAPMGEICEIPEGLRCCLGQRMVLLRVNHTMHPKYLLYAIQSPYLQNQIGWSEGTGTTVSNIRLPDLRAFDIPTPPLKIQKWIAQVLSALDDKIELNRKINATLEAMTQALFKSWFVDFDPVIDNALAAGNPIPEPLQARAEIRKALGDQRKPLPDNLQQQFSNRFVLTDEMGWVPEGWEVTSLDDIFDLIGGGTPKTSIEDYWNGNILWFSVVDAPHPSNVFVQRTEKYISEEGLNNSSAQLLPIGTTIISARGTVGKCALVGQPMAMNQSCYGIQGKTGISDYFVYYTVLLRVSDLQQRGHGSVFNTITRDTFKSIKTAVCAEELTAVFHNQIEPYFSRILENNQQSDCLAKLRDTLLPKLLSGELQVPEAEAIIDKQLAEV
jgi:type I restriction enzyme S subunit